MTGTMSLILLIIGAAIAFVLSLQQKREATDLTDLRYNRDKNIVSHKNKMATLQATFILQRAGEKSTAGIAFFFFFQKDLVRINASPVAIANRKGNRAEIRARLVLNAHL